MSTKYPNRIFGEYTLKRKLGVGGMATVYYAIHNKLQREVAIKIIHEHFADNEVVNRRLEREAQITKKLRHPNIVPIITFNRVDNRPYLVMPYYAGKTLADYFDTPRAVPHDVTLNILSKLADALDYAHSHGVIHRDFKLENILLDKRGEPAISDFGIAQVVNSTRLTATGNILGTPQYMAPEQVSASRDEHLNYRIDLYAFGVMAYLMLTGLFPFTDDDPIKLIVKHNTQPVPPPTNVNRELPQTIDSVLIRALAKNPDHRYENATAFIELLSSTFQDKPTITTLIDVNKLNPIETPSQFDTNQVGLTTNILPNEDNAQFASDDALQTPFLGNQAEPINNVPSKPKRRRLAFMSILLLILIVAGLTTVFAISGNNAVSAFTDAENTEDPDMTNALVAENTEELTLNENTATVTLTEETVSASITPSVTNTVRATNTRRPTNTSSPTTTPSATNTRRPTSTPTLTNTVRPSNTPRPLPTNTPVPPPPPTSVPVQPTNPPNNNNPVAPIIEPIVEPVAPIINTAVPDGGCILGIGC